MTSVPRESLTFTLTTARAALMQRIGTSVEDSKDLSYTGAAALDPIPGLASQRKISAD